MKDLHTPSHVYMTILWIGYLNSAINPIMYVLHLQDIKGILSKYVVVCVRNCCGGRAQNSEDYELDMI